VSSPGDVAHERARVERVVSRLNVELSAAVTIEVVRWETKFYSSHQSFQAQIPEAAECDIVVAILFGADLVQNYHKRPSDGERRPLPQR
jgi:hypothetical protein